MNKNSLPKIPNIDEVIHSPARLAIMSILSIVKEADFVFLLHATQLTRGNLSVHLTKLEKAGYIEIEKTFRGRLPLTICRLTPKGLSAYETYRKSMLDFLNMNK
ncbi:MAG: transcriptional regulator [Caldisericia bacterium]|jgi:DNA-binding transcriptional ArsR family regulator|nr:transcriptional regulator [Caldisericia bacterium]